ncbi:hypothetical protein DL96DRAFT_233642 [Flagelloscypha sp. PMI_526]|nr:hypothetical protein DL96DRAFT_233642 [Flagelloscypha sp. PMI_526]
MLQCLNQVVGIVPTLLVVLVSVNADSASLQEKFSSLRAESASGPPVSHRLSFAKITTDGDVQTVEIVSDADAHEHHLRKP